MTKTVRIENGCTSTYYGVRIEIFEKRNVDGEIVDSLVETHILAHPTALKEVLLYQGRMIKITEISEQELKDYWKSR